MENDSSAKWSEGAPDEEPLYFAYSASLRISGAIPDIEAITRQLGLHPTHVHRRGEFRRPGATPYQAEMWIYEAQVGEGEPLDRHIDHLCERLRDHKLFIRQLKTSLKVDVFLGYRSNSDTAGVEIPHQSLAIFTELEVPFGLSIIIA